MKHLLTLAVLLLPSAVYAQGNAHCIPGQPSSPWPGPLFVATLDCQGWVPMNHPAAPPQDPPAQPAVPAVLSASQDVIVVIETPRATPTGPISLVSGWALHCRLGSLPPVMNIVETKPDGSRRELPNNFFAVQGARRPDVQTAYRGTCPAVMNAPAADGGSLGPNDQFGWSISLRSPITEPGEHTFTAIFTWPGQGSSGSSSVTVTVR